MVCLYIGLLVFLGVGVFFFFTLYGSGSQNLLYCTLADSLILYNECFLLEKV